MQGLRTLIAISSTGKSDDAGRLSTAFECGFSWPSYRYAKNFYENSNTSVRLSN
jgi:hypothetical protein